MQLYGYEEQHGHIFFCVYIFLVKKSNFYVPRVEPRIDKGAAGGRDWRMWCYPI